MDGPTGHMLAMLQEMNRNRRPWTIQDFVDHDNLGGVHRKRAIKYSLDKLEAQKLIERCDAPAGLVLKGRKPNFWHAVGTDVPGKFSSRARGASVGESVKSQTSSPGTDLNDKPPLSKVSDCQKSPKPDLLTKADLLTKPDVVKNPSPGKDQAFDAQDQVYGDIPPLEFDAPFFG